MTADEYLAWAEGRQGRFELYAGLVYAMTPAHVGHGKIKFAMQTALVDAIRRTGLNCHMLPDGMTVRVDRDTAHEPDALVYCGDELPHTAIEVPNRPSSWKYSRHPRDTSMRLPNLQVIFVSPAYGITLLSTLTSSSRSITRVAKLARS
jgi:hypothetical protein